MNCRWWICLGLVGYLGAAEAAHGKSLIAYETLLGQCGRPCHGRLHRLPPARINRLLRHLQKKFSYHQRLQILSAMFLGAPYSFGPLGEGPKGKWDRDPIFRMDRVDCVTYLETVMALAISSNLSQARRILQKIRYRDGQIQFHMRNHFTGAQWLPENDRAGYIKPLSSFGQFQATPLSKSIPADLWKRRAWRWWAKRLPHNARPRSYTIHYVPLKDIPKMVSSLPAVGWMGEIFNHSKNPITVRHVGFFVRQRGQVFFRHANRPRVQEMPLLRYARWRARLAKRARKGVRIIGFSFAFFPVPPEKTAASR